MVTFTCLLTDARYAVPTLHFLDATTRDEAVKLARRELAASRHHESFELLEDDRPVAAGRR